MTRRLFALGLTMLAAACGHDAATSASSATASASASGSSSAGAPAASAGEESGGRALALLKAEHLRAATAVTPSDQQSRDVVVRRAAARALARIGGEAARPGLLRALADEDGEVVAWAAYGLGFFCKGHEKDNVSALVARALGGWSKPAAAEPAASGAHAELDPENALGRAIGRCAAEESEPTLVAWLAAPRPRAIAAAYGLGDVATSKSKLREETFAALLNAAAGSAAAPPMAEALFAAGRVENVPPSVVGRLREVATARLAEPGPARFLAVRALARGGEDAAVELARVLGTPAAFNAAERAEAARALKKIPRVGVRLLGETLPKLVPSSDPVALTGLVTDDTGVLLSALDALSDVSVRDEKAERGAGLGASAKKALAELAALPSPKDAPAPIVRRISWIRCLAAEAIAGADYRDKALAACDLEVDKSPHDSALPEGLPVTSIGARAMVDVLGRAPLEGPRLTAFRAYAERGELRAREAAIELLAEHEEVKDADEILAAALLSKSPGLVGGAAEVLAKKPQRASRAPKHVLKRKKRGKGKADIDEIATETSAPSQALVDALTNLAKDPAHTNDPELLDAVVDATGALGLQLLKARLVELCHGAYPTTREHAEKALGMLGDKTTCEPPPEGGSAPVELEHLVDRATTIAFDTDIGPMTITLDPTFAPVAVTRFVDLVKAKFYDGLVVHRVVPGFVSQFGAPEGDGAGGPPGMPALRCETSPLPFELGAVGVALAGRDTGSSQLFVMHTRHPHLDGGYALVGSATGAWGAFVDGDHIRTAKLVER